MQLANAGDLLSEVITGNSQFNENIAKVFFVQIINGLECIHSKLICHLDLKLENILIDVRFKKIDGKLDISDIDLFNVA